MRVFECFTLLDIWLKSRTKTDGPCELYATPFKAGNEPCDVYHVIRTITLRTAFWKGFFLNKASTFLPYSNFNRTTKLLPLIPCELPMYLDNSSLVRQRISNWTLSQFHTTSRKWNSLSRGSQSRDDLLWVRRIAKLATTRVGIGSLRSYDMCCNENVTFKWNFALS